MGEVVEGVEMENCALNWPDLALKSLSLFLFASACRVLRIERAHGAISLGRQDRKCLRNA